MMKKFHILFIMVVVFSIQYGCKKIVNSDHGKLVPQDIWLVDASEILYMGTEMDRIQSIDSPVFVPIHNIDIQANELLFAIHHNGITKVYPQSVLGIHEIVNDQIEDFYYAVTFCPLTGSGIAWNRNINGIVTEFGVSGMLYRDNLIPYDRNTLSYWSQMKSVCINGNLLGYEAEAIQLVTATYSMIKNAYPDAIILDHDVCGGGICGSLKTIADFGDPSDITDLPPGSRYFGVTDIESLLLFDDGLFTDSIQLYKTTFRQHKIIVIGNRTDNYFHAFVLENNLRDNSFYTVQGDLPIIMKDNLGNTYDLFGNVIEGPAKGFRLKSADAYLAHTFAWQAFFNAITIFE